MFISSVANSTTGGITVNYTSSVAPIIDQIIATKGDGKVTKVL